MLQIILHKTVDSRDNMYIYGNNLGNSVSGTRELTFGYSECQLINTQSLDKTHSSYSSTGSGVHPNVNIRPAFVIKGDSKVIDGDGTETNPYIISRFI